MLCYDCNGSGQVADERVIWARDGELLRACRERRDLSLREAARWVGVPASEWSAAEHGRVDPSELIGKVQRAAVEKIRKGAGL
jgi:transcriptional regulator with XRE-family HTH domain